MECVVKILILIAALITFVCDKEGFLSSSTLLLIDMQCKGQVQPTLVAALPTFSVFDMSDMTTQRRGRRAADRILASRC